MTPLMKLAAAWLAGIAIAMCLRPSPATAAWVAIAMATALVALGRFPWQRGRGFVPAAAPSRSRAAAVNAGVGLAMVVALATCRYAWADRPPDSGHVSRFNGHGQVALAGQIVDEPEMRDRGVHYRLAAVTARGGSDDGAPQPVHGLVLIQTSAYPLFDYGDHVVLTTTLEAPPQLDGFDYRAYLARHDIYSIARHVRLHRLASGGNPVRRALIGVKARAKAALAEGIAEPEAALATGILLGDDHGLPARLAADFRTTNTSHVIAISGSNIALLVTVVAALFGRLGGRRRAAFATVIVVGLYTVLVGADPAVVRAAVMGGIAVLGRPWGRRQHGPTALAAAALAMTAWQPMVIHDLGFQLSFAATAGLMGLTMPVERAVLALFGRLRGSPVAVGPHDKRLGIVRESLFLTLAAELATWPLIATSTGQVSSVGLGANLLILPAQPFIMLGAALTAIAGTALAPAGRLVGAFTWLPLTWTIHVVEAAARLPSSSIAWRLPPAGAATYYVGLIVFAGPGLRGFLTAARRGSAQLRRSTRDGRHWLLKAGAAARQTGGWRLVALLASSAAIVWTGNVTQPDGLLHLFVLDVGQGDALLVVAPHGQRMLVDGGPGKSGVLAGLGRRWPPWDRRLDFVVLTHPDADHVGGLAGVLDRYQVSQVLDPQLDGHSGEAAAWLAGLRHEGAAVVRAESGARIWLDEAAGVSARVLWPPAARRLELDPPTNNNAVVLRIEYGRIALLLTGDIEAPVEEALLASKVPLGADVLKVAHHGSAGSSGEAFLGAVRPRLALFSVGAGNSFGHPAPATLARMEGVPIRRTDLDGTIEVITDGRGLWVR